MTPTDRPQTFLGMYAAMVRTAMERPTIRAARVEEAMVAHILHEGHDIVVPFEALIGAGRKRGELTIDVTEDGALKFSVRGTQPASAATAGRDPHADDPGI